MKKILIALTTACIGLCLAGCSGGDSAPITSSDEPSQSQEQTAAAKDFDGSGYSEMGEGVFYISTPAGNTEGGNIPKMTIDANTSMTQVSYAAEGFDGVPVTYIYLDGMQSSKGNMGDSMSTITLQDDSVKPGTHTIEAVQFAGDDPAGEVTLYKVGTFEIAN